jgi:hypothetical protein|tara:strand:- start:362 stop:562 length:201 start_codon:yes stop_codon:yes gene_type:complete
MTKEIKNPTEKTYFIAYTDTDVFCYGTTSTDQQTITEQPNLWESTSEEDWLKELKDVYSTTPETPY